MPIYPIILSVPSSLIKRKIPRSILREYAKRIENYLNNLALYESVSVVDYHLIAGELGIDKKIIKAFLAPIGGGSNGITINNPKVKK